MNRIFLFFVILLRFALTQAEETKLEACPDDFKPHSQHNLKNPPIKFIQFFGAKPKKGII